MSDSDTEVADATPTSQHSQQEVNKLLCFIQQKCNILPNDDLLKIRLDFYKPDEVENARSTCSGFHLLMLNMQISAPSCVNFHLCAMKFVRSCTLEKKFIS